MDMLLIFPILASFFITLFAMPFWIRKAKDIGLIWDDMNKLNSEKVAGSGGLIAVVGFIAGVFIYIAYLTFYLKSGNGSILEILALSTSVLFLAGIGFIDDLLGWQKGGLRRRTRLALVALAAIPLMVINAGQSEISIPLLGAFNLGILYPLILVPLGIVGATATYNFLAGFNGLEASQGIILLSGIALVSYFTGNAWLSVILICMIASLIAFLIYNWSPAKVFPGDAITYSIGGLIAISAILGNFEKIAVFFFIPYIIETILKSRGRLVKHSFGLPQKDGSLSLRYNKIYGLTHLFIYLLNKLNIKPTERKVVIAIGIFQLIIIIAGLIIFREGIFIR